MGKLNPDADGWFDLPPQIVYRDENGVHQISMDDAVKLVRQRWAR